MRSRRPLALRLLCATVALWLLLPAYAPADELDHAAALDALRERMRRVAELMYERTLTPLEVDRERVREAAVVADLAGELAAAANALGQSSQGPTADAERRRLFLDNAEQLAREAAELGRLAAEDRVGEMPAQLERVSHACAACHSEFRPSARAR